MALFESDFKVVAKFFVNKRKNKDYIPDDSTTLKHMDEVLKLLSAMTGDDRYEAILSDKKEIRTMCDVAQKLEEIGIEKGIEKSVLNMHKKNYAIEEIADIVEISVDEVKAIIAKKES